MWITRIYKKVVDWKIVSWDLKTWKGKEKVRNSILEVKSNGKRKKDDGI